MRGTVQLRLSDKAAQDLRDLGFLERRLVPQAIRDQLVAASQSDVETLDEASVKKIVPQAVQQASTPLLSSQNSTWLSLRIGDYRAIVRPERSEETGDFGAFVAAIVPETEVTSTSESSNPSSEAAAVADAGTQ